MTELTDRQQIIAVTSILIGGVIVYRLLLLATSQLRRLAAFEQDDVRKARRQQRAETLRSILNNFIGIAILCLVVLLILDRFSVNVAPIVAGAGLLGIALAFGAQSLVRDYLAGIFIIVENQFDIGDQITVAGHTGVVDAVTLRMTRLLDTDGGVHIVPNGKIEAVVVHARDWARATVDLTIPYTEDVARALDVVGVVAREFGETNANTLDGVPEVLGVDDLTPLGPRLRVTVKTKPGSQLPVARELRRRIKAAFDESGIRFATSEEEAPAPAQTTAPS